MASEKSKYVLLFEKYKRLIIKRNLAHSKLPSTRIMAKENQVSIITARRCLTELFNEGLVYTKEGVGTFVADLKKITPVSSLKEISLLGYRPSKINSQSNYACIYRALYELAEASNIHINEVSITEISKYDDPQQFFNSNGLQGNLIFGLINEPFIQRIYKILPTVLIDSWIPTIQTDSIVVDNMSLTYQLTKHLIQLGHKQIAFIGAERTDQINKIRQVDPDTFEKFAGYTMALEENNFPLINELVFSSYSIQTDEKELIENLLNSKPKPTALICCNDNFANRVLVYCQTKNISVPNDLSLATFTMNPINLNSFLTCAYISPKEFAQKALDCLKNQVCNQINSGSKISIQGQIIKNRSSGVPTIQQEAHS